MRKRTAFLFLLLFAGAFMEIRSQEADVAALQERLSSAQGPQRVDLLNQLAKQLERKQPKDAKAYAEQAYDLSEDIHYQQGFITSAYFLGFHERQNTRFRRAERYTKAGIEAARSISEPSLELQGIEQLAGIYQAWGRANKLEEASELYKQLQTRMERDRKTAEVSRLEQEISYRENTISQLAEAKERVEDSLSLTAEEGERNRAEAEQLRRIKVELELLNTQLRNDSIAQALDIIEQENQLLQYQTRLERQQFLVTLTVVGLAAAALIIVLLVRYNRLKRIRAEEKTETQRQLMVQEKMATLGQLTAGIAHEIKNPLNFVNNFAEGSDELTQELAEAIIRNRPNLPPDQYALFDELAVELRQNAADILSHGQRADRIVRSMMDHARGDTGTHQPVDLNTLLRENLNLAHQGFWARHPDFQITLQENYDDSLQTIQAIPTELSRVFLNIFNNACEALYQKQKETGEAFTPTLSVSSRKKGSLAVIRIRDNGPGIPTAIRNQIFTPFFTTKPTGEGHTGLGLSISYDIIVQGHEGKLAVESEEGRFTEFIIQLPAGS